jgi:hypothetical protein
MDWISRKDIAICRISACSPSKRVAERLLFTVYDAFHVRGFAWVLLPGVLRGDALAVGDAVELRGGAGPTRTGVVRAIGAFGRRGESVDTMPLLVELDPTQKPLLINAEVWQVDKP